MLSRLSKREMFRSFRHHNYRRFYVGNLLSNTGTWIQRVAQDWLVIDLTHSPTALGIVTSLQFGPAIFFSLHGGSLADRFDKRIWVLWTNAVAAACSLTIGVLIQTHAITINWLYVLATVLGIASAVQAPIWQTFIHDLVGSEDLPNAIALNSTNFNIGRLIGPALSGFLIAGFGTGPSFLVNAASYAASMYALASMRTRELFVPQHKRDATEQGVLAGLRYLATRRDIIVILIIISAAGTFGLNYQMFMTLMSRNVFKIPADSFGILGSCMAVGSVSGALLIARRRSAPTARLVQGLALGFGTVTGLAGLSPTYVAYAFALPVCGFAALMMLSTANAFVQGTCDPTFRGRVMGVYMLVFIGGTPIGSMTLGWMAEHIGVRIAIATFGAIVAAVAGASMVVPLARTMTATPALESDTSVESSRG